MAGGEDYGYFALNAGGRRFDSCRGNYARVAQWIEHLYRFRLFPGQVFVSLVRVARTLLSANFVERRRHARPEMAPTVHRLETLNYER